MAISAPNIIAENSAATPGLWNSIVTQLWQNDIAISNGTFGLSSNTLTPESGDTITATSNKFVVAKLFAGGANGYAQLASGVPSASFQSRVDVLRTNTAPTFNLQRQNGSASSALPVAAGDQIGIFAMGGFTGSGIATSAVYILSNALENWTSTARGAALYFGATPSGAAASATYLSLDPDGGAQISLQLGVLESPAGSVGLNLPASLTTRSTMRVNPGVAPTSPADGDEWSTATSRFAQIGGSTYNLGQQVLSAMANSNTIPAGTTHYTCPGGVTGATEAVRQMVVPIAKVFSRLCFVTTTAQPVDGTLVAVLRKNGADSIVSVTVAAGAAASTFSELANKVAFAQGDLLSIAWTNASGSASANIAGASLVCS